jgi:hypothetical protein
LLMSPEETRMDIAQRQRQAVVLSHAPDDQSVWHAIANQGIGHGVTDLIGIAAAVGHPGNGGLKILATVASRLIDADLSLDPRATMESRHMTNTPPQDALAFAFLAAVWTRSRLGLNRVALNIIIMAADQLGVSHKLMFKGLRNPRLEF